MKERLCVDRPKEFRFDEPAQAILRSTIEQRYRLLPYIYPLSWRVAQDGYTMSRPLAMDFPADSVAVSIGDQFMFGPGLLINPVTQPGAVSRNVYLPAGSGWYDFNTHKRYAGGTLVTADAPLGERATIALRWDERQEYAHLRRSPGHLPRHVWRSTWCPLARGR